MQVETQSFSPPSSELLLNLESPGSVFSEASADGDSGFLAAKLGASPQASVRLCDFVVQANGLVYWPRIQVVSRKSTDSII